MTAETTSPTETLDVAQRERRQKEVLYGHASEALLRDVAGIASVARDVVGSGRYSVEEFGDGDAGYQFMGVDGDNTGTIVHHKLGLNVWGKGDVEIRIVDERRDGGTKTLVLAKDDQGQDTILCRTQFAHVETIPSAEGVGGEGITRGELIAYLQRLVGGEFPGLPAELATAVRGVLENDSARLVQQMDLNVTVAQNETLLQRIQRWRIAFGGAMAALALGAAVHFQKPLEEGLEVAGEGIEEVGEDIEDAVKEAQKAFEKWGDDDKSKKKNKRKAKKD